MLVAEHIAKSFGEKRVLRDVSMTLNDGKVHVLTGTNGCGKTTLFNIISGFLPSDDGKIVLNGKNISKMEPNKLNLSGISRTFQDMRLISDLTVLENVLLSFSGQVGEKWWKVLLPSRKIKEEQQKNEKKADAILEKCFISDVKKSKAGEISYGQQKLLNLACCIVNDGKVFLLDEPVAGVNINYREKLTEIIRTMKESGKALLIIEHNTDFIEAVADEILFLNNGVITTFDNYNELKNNKEVQEAYI